VPIIHFCWDQVKINGGRDLDTKSEDNPQRRGTLSPPTQHHIILALLSLKGHANVQIDASDWMAREPDVTTFKWDERGLSFWRIAYLRELTKLGREIRAA